MGPVQRLVSRYKTFLCGLPDELLGDVDIGPKVTWRVKWQSGNNTATIAIVAAAVDTADSKKGPSRRIPRVGYAGSRGFEEVKLVDRTAVHRTRQNSEELQHNAPS
jgi:hypothetical protein